MLPYIYTILANVCFAAGSISFTTFSERIGPIWMNRYKAIVALFFFFGTSLILGEIHFPEMKVFSFLFLSGFIGLGIGDFFILKAFVKMGPGRTLMIFGFQPLLIGIFSNIFLGQELRVEQIIGVFFCVACILILGRESDSKRGEDWVINGIVLAFAGIIFDAVGLVLSRMSFEQDPLLTTFNVNIFRIFGALVALQLLTFFKSEPKLTEGVKSLSKRDLIIVSSGAILGTYISLSFYLKAIQIGNLGVVSAVSLSGVLFSATFECIKKRQWPSKYFMLAMSCFFIGMYFVLKV